MLRAGRIGANAIPHERVFLLDLKSQDALALTLPNGDPGKLTVHGFSSVCLLFPSLLSLRLSSPLPSNI